jgi:hypothetical protein
VRGTLTIVRSVSLSSLSQMRKVRRQGGIGEREITMQGINLQVSGVRSFTKGYAPATPARERAMSMLPLVGFLEELG